MPSPRDIDPPVPRLLLSAGGRHVELEVDALEEVLPAARSVPVAGGPAWVAGVGSWRGRVVTLVDSGLLFGCRPTDGAWMAVLKGLPVDAALLVDGKPRLAGRDDAADLVLDRAALAAHECLQPGAARPAEPAAREES